MRPADRAWLGIAAAVTAYEIAACRRPGWELLSTALDRYRASNLPARVATNTVIGYLAAHLTRLVPRRFDLLTRLADWLSRNPPRKGSTA